MLARWCLLAVLCLAADGADDLFATGQDDLLATGQMHGLSIAVRVLRGQIKQMNGRLNAQHSQLVDLTAQMASLQSDPGQLATQPSRPPKPTGNGKYGTCKRSYPQECSQLQGDNQSGIHLLQPGLDPSQEPIPAFCDMDTDGGGWTVFQRRADIKPRQNFFLGWSAYKRGFGELDAEFWWGLENLFKMTSRRDRNYILQIDLEDFAGEKRHAVYQRFRVSSEDDGYRLQALNYTGNTGDSLSGHNGMKFTTLDKDHDLYGHGNCAKSSKGAWWYHKCHDSNLNGEYLSGKIKIKQHAVTWSAWKKWYSLKNVVMKIKQAP